MNRNPWSLRDYGYLLAVSLPMLVLAAMLVTGSLFV